MRTFTWLAPALLLLVLGCAFAGDDKPAPSKRVKEWMGDHAASVIAEAARVECFRLDPAKRDKEKGCGGFAITATAREAKADFARKLAAILCDEDTYLFDVAKACIFSPGVGYRLWKDKASVDVILCFSCDELEVSTTPPGKERKVAHEDFDRAREGLVALAKEAFPDDKEIQGLVGKRK